MPILSDLHIYKITRTDYATLWNNGAKNGSIIKGGVTYGFEDNAIYLIQDQASLVLTQATTSATAAQSLISVYSWPDETANVRYQYLRDGSISSSQDPVLNWAWLYYLSIWTIGSKSTQVADKDHVHTLSGTSTADLTYSI